MKLTLRQVFDCQGAMRKLMIADVPARTAFKLSRLANQLNSVFKDIEVQRIKLVEKFGEQLETGTQVKEENMPQFQNELNGLFDEEIELELEAVSLDDLAEVRLSALDMHVLVPFLKE